MACGWFTSGRKRKAEKDTPPPSPPVPTPIPVGGPLVIRVTDDADGPMAPRFYPGWANAFLAPTRAVVFAGHSDERPRFFSVDLLTGDVSREGDMGCPYGGTTEGWSWDREGRLILCAGPRLHRLQFQTWEDEVLLDLGPYNPGYDLWQPHSSNDGQVHAATMRDAAHPTENGRYPYVGTVIKYRGGVEYVEQTGKLDESAVTQDGSIVVIKETRNGSEDNLVLDFETGDRWWITDRERAIAHSDCGPDFIIGEADKPDPGGCGIWYLKEHRFQFLFPSLNMGYVSYRGGVCIYTDDIHIGRLDIITGERTPLHAHGGPVLGSPNYDEDRVKASLDHTGAVCTFMVNGSVYLLRL